MPDTRMHPTPTPMPAPAPAQTPLPLETPSLSEDDRKRNYERSIRRNQERDRNIGVQLNPNPIIDTEARLNELQEQRALLERNIADQQLRGPD